MHLLEMARLSGADYMYKKLQETKMKTYRSTKEIAQTIRETLKRELPEWKFSVRMKSFAGGSSIDLALVSGPEDVVEAYYNHVHNFPRFDAKPEDYQFKVAFTEKNPFSGYAQLNHYQILANRDSERELRLSNGIYLTPTGWEVMRKAIAILSREHWDDSDIQSDYFSTNFYMHVSIGQWDKPYRVR